MNDIFPDKEFLRDTNNFVFPVFVENNNIVHIRAIAHKFIFFKSRSDKSFFSVDIEFLVCFDNFDCLNRFKIFNFR